MPTRELALLALRLLAIYTAIQSFMLLAGLFGPEISDDKSTGNLGLLALFVFVLPLFIAWLIWRLSPYLAKHAAAGLSEEINLAKLSPESLATAGLVVAGAVILVLTAPNLFALFLMALKDLSKISIPLIGAAAAKCLLAAVLLLRARPIAGRLVKSGRAAFDDGL